MSSGTALYAMAIKCPVLMVLVVLKALKVLMVLMVLMVGNRWSMHATGRRFA